MNQCSSLFRHLLRSRLIPSLGQIQVRYIKRFTKERLLVLQARKRKEAMFYPKTPTPRFQYLEWNYNSEIFAFAKRLGENFDEDYLRQAFTDKSYAVEQTKKQEELGLETMQIKDNQSLTQDGRNLVRKTLDKCLKAQFPKLPTEGIDNVVNYLMSEPVLADISSSIGTKDLILSNEYPPSESNFTETLLAIIGALEKSSGVECAEKFIRHFILTYLWNKDINEIWDIPKPWAMLQDLVNQKGESIEPRLLRESGRNEILSVFVVGLYDSSKKLIGTGIGETVDIAQEMAARDALKIMFDTRDTMNSLRFD